MSEFFSDRLSEMGICQVSINQSNFSCIIIIISNSINNIAHVSDDFGGP